MGFCEGGGCELAAVVNDVGPVGSWLGFGVLGLLT